MPLSPQCKRKNIASGIVAYRRCFYRKEDSDCIYVDNDTRIQIVETMAFLSRADKEQCGAFIVSWQISDILPTVLTVRPHAA